MVMDKEIKFDPTKDDATQVAEKVSRQLSEMIAPQLEEQLESIANEKIWAHPQIKDNNIPSSSLAASVIYDIDPMGGMTLTLHILNDEIEGTKDIEISAYTRKQVTGDPTGGVTFERSSTGAFTPKGEGKVSSHTRSLVNQRHFQLSDGSWITSSSVPAEILTEVVQETITEILGGG